MRLTKRMHWMPERRRALFSAVLAGLLVLAGAPLMAGEFQPGSVRFEDVVPADSYVCLTFEGLNRCEKAFEQSGLYKTWLEPEVQAFVGELMQMLRQQIAASGTGGFPLNEIRSVLQGRIGFAMGDMTMVGLLAVVPAPVLSIDTGSHTEHFRQLLNGGLEEAKAAYGGMKLTSFDYKGVTIQSLPCPKLRRTSLCFTFLDNLFVAGLNKYYLQRMVDNYKSPGHGLSASPSFKRSMSKAGSDQFLASLFLNIDGVKSKLRALAPPELNEVAEELGIAGINSVFFGWTASGTGYRDYCYVDVPGEKKGLVKILAPGPASKDAMHLAPYNTVYFVNFNLDLAGAIHEALAICDMFYPPIRQKVDQFRAGVRQQIGFDIHDDLIASLGQGFSLSVSMPSNGGLIPDVLATINLRDTARFEECLLKLARIPGGTLKSMQYNGHEMKYLSLEGRNLPFTPAPAYAIEGNTLYLAGAPLVLKEAIRNRTRGEMSLADNPGFQAVAAKLGSSPSSIEYLDLPRGVSLLYGTFAPFLQGLQGKVDQAGIPLDLALLPTTETLTKHLSGIGGSYSVDQDGLLSQKYSPFGLGGVVCLAAKMMNALEGLPPMGPVVRGVRGTVREFARPRLIGGGVDRVVARGAQASSRGAQEIFQDSYQLHANGDYDQAIAGFQKCARMGFIPSTCYYNIACGYSLKNEKDKAFEWLKKAIDAGFENQELIERDEDLDNIRNDPRFAKITKGGLN